MTEGVSVILGRGGAFVLVLAACAKPTPAPPPPPAPVHETASAEETTHAMGALRARLADLARCLHVEVTFQERHADALEVSFDVEETEIARRRFRCEGKESEPLYWIDSATLPRKSGFLVRVAIVPSIFPYAEARHWESPCAHDYGDSRATMKSGKGVTVELLRMLPKPSGRPPFAAIVLLHGSELGAAFEEDIRAAAYGTAAVQCHRAP